ncbi:MAG: hypothetical protein HY815_30855 [Candidatus Riflebacteria bacterium]|nr:hypothetical protein [Candidatus Riflebacteria bacterium]
MQDLKAVAALGQEPPRDSFGAYARSSSYDDRRRMLVPRREYFAPGGRAEKEFIRFVSQEVLPRFSKLIKEPGPIQVGDRVIMTWRRYIQATVQAKALTIVMLGQTGVVVRSEALTAVGDSEEMDLPAGFLPRAPAPHVGQELVLYRADDLALACRFVTSGSAGPAKRDPVAPRPPETPAPIKPGRTVSGQ